MQAEPGNFSHETDNLGVTRCVDIALRCVDKDRNKRPCIKDVVHELEELEAEIDLAVPVRPERPLPRRPDDGTPWPWRPIIPRLPPLRRSWSGHRLPEHRLQCPLLLQLLVVVVVHLGGEELEVLPKRRRRWMHVVGWVVGFDKWRFLVGYSMMMMVMITVDVWVISQIVGCFSSKPNQPAVNLWGSVDGQLEASCSSSGRQY